MMNDARISVGLGAAALAYTGYLHALDYARTRKQGRVRGHRDPASEQTPIIDHPDVRRMLLAQKAYASGSLALCLYASRLSDDAASLEVTAARREATLLLDLLTPIVKSWPSQWGLAGNDLAIQVHGGYGYTREYNVEQFYRDNRLNAIHEGTFGIQALDLLGRKVRIEGGAGLGLLGSKVAATCARASQSQILARHAAALLGYWDQLVSVTSALGALEDKDAQVANAAPYLEAFGHIVLGWLWLDQAICAETAITNAAGPNLNFYRGKLATCDFYFGWEMPKVPAWLKVLNPVERTPLDVHSEWL
jgi:Acetyl-CoA dehydrogenase C-terminal like/Acyl-CoA dehydrogenase, C-terminal domain